MDNEKPSCPDFILETICFLRPYIICTMGKWQQGVNIVRVLKIVREAYSEDEIRSALQQLLDDNTILITAVRYWPRKKEDIRDKWRGFGTPSKVTSIPVNLGSGAEWYLDQEGEYVKSSTLIRQPSLKKIMLYIRVDGLPQCASLIETVAAERVAPKKKQSEIVFSRMEEKAKTNPANR